MIMRFIVFILGMLFLGVLCANAQTNTGNTGTNSAVNEIKIDANDNFDVNQKFRTDLPAPVEQDPNKKSIKVDRTQRIPMQKVEGECKPKVERSEE